MSTATSAHADIANGAAGNGREARLATILLAVLIAASAALSFWLLPAVPRLDTEGAGIANIEVMMGGDEIRRHGGSSLAWYPQLLAVRLADRIFDGSEAELFHVATAKGRLTRRGLNLARFFSLLYGLAAILLLYLIARRLHSTTVALLAALILCFSPWQLQGAVTFAPDTLVLSLSLLALWLGLRALDEPSPARFGLAGLALGGAAAVKLTGGLVAVPVLLGLIGGWRREPRRMILPLAITAPVALLTWWALSPPLELLAGALELERAVEARRAVQQMSSRFTVAVFGFLYPLRQSVHGPVIGALALLGAAGQAFRCLFLVDPGPQRAHRLMVLAAAPVFIFGTALATPLYRDSSFVPLLAFSSLYAAVMLGILWDGLVALVPRLGSPGAAAVAAVLVAALVVPSGWRYVHPKAGGSTIGTALDWLRKDLQTGGPRLVLVEEAALASGSATAMQLARGIAVKVVPRLSAIAGERLGRADGEVFLRRELNGADGSFYRGRIDGPVRHKVVAGNALWQQGPDLVAVLHAFAGASLEEVPLASKPRDKLHVANVPAIADGAAVLSLALELPATAEAAPVPPRARLGGVDIDLAPAGRVGGHSLFFTERLPATPNRRRMVIEPPPWMSARHGELKIAMYVWR